MSSRNPSRVRIGGRARAFVPLATAVALLLIPSDASAYIDPGTGSLAYQTALAILVGAGLYFRQAWRRIARAILALRRSPTAGDSSRSADDNGS